MPNYRGWVALRFKYCSSGDCCRINRRGLIQTNMGFMQDDGKSEPDDSVSENEQLIVLLMTHIWPQNLCLR